MTTQEVIKSLRMIKSTCYIGNRKFLDALEQAVEMLEAQEWIPCKERLPEDSGRYLISILDGIGRRTTVTSYQPRYKAWTMTGRMAYWKVLAWKPLPEPYREDGDGDEDR